MPITPVVTYIPGPERPIASTAVPVPVVIVATGAGFVAGRAPTFRLSIPASIAGADKVHADLFNAAGSGTKLCLLSVLALVDNTVSVIGLTGLEIALKRTSTVGTGGTLATNETSSLLTPCFSILNPGVQPLPVEVTARLNPAGGAVAGAWIGSRRLFAEETSDGAAYAGAVGAQYVGAIPITVPEGTGVMFVQGGVASAGSICFEIEFTIG